MYLFSYTNIITTTLKYIYFCNINYKSSNQISYYNKCMNYFFTKLLITYYIIYYIVFIILQVTLF